MNTHSLNIAEIQGSAAPAPIFPTLTEAWLNVTKDKTAGVTVHRFNGENIFNSYSDLLRESQKIAVGLKNRGVRPHDRVVLFLPTSPEFIIIYFGALLAEAIPVPMYPPMGTLSLKAYRIRTQGMLDNITPSVLVSTEKYKNFLSPLVTGFTHCLGIFETQELIGKLENYITPVPMPEDIALIQFSSGTTSSPKPVALSHRNLMANITAISFHYQECEPVRLHNFSWLPLYHDMGLIGNLLMPLVWNCPNELLPPQDFITRPWLWLQLMSKTGAISSAAPNFAYSMCLKRIKDKHMEGVDLSDWQWAINGAETINPQVVKDFETRFSKWGFQSGTIIPAYGLSEASLAVSIGRVRQGTQSNIFNADFIEKNIAQLNKNGKTIISAGYPLWGTHIRIGVPYSSSKFLGKNAIGEVLVKSDSVMEGYLQADGTITQIESDWLQTGDLGFIFKDQLYICGRLKNLIIKNGRNIYTHDLEATILNHESTLIENCIVVSGSVNGEENIYIFVEVPKIKETGKENIPDLKNIISNQVLKEHGFRVDHVILFKRNMLPRTSSGKLRYQYTLTAYLNDKLNHLIVSQIH